MNIIVDNQEFEKTEDICPEIGIWYKNSWYRPVSQFKVGDWVSFYSEMDNKHYTSKIYKVNASSYFTLENGLEPFKHLCKKATEKEICEHLKEVAKEKGLVKGAKVKRLNVLDNSTFATIVQEDDDYYSEQDEYCKSGIILYSNGRWVEKIEEPKFTFGGYEVTFKVASHSFLDTKVEINCKGETGTHQELANILTHYFRPMPFGNVKVKKWIPKSIYYIDIHKGIQVYEANRDKEMIEEITIGCLTGKYRELVDIYNHCLKLLK